MQGTADLPDLYHSFPQDIALTDQRPNIIIWSPKDIHLVELSVLFETNLPDTATHNETHYQDLKAACSLSHYTTVFILEVGSRGFFCAERFKRLHKLLRTTPSEQRSLEQDIIRHVITQSCHMCVCACACMHACVCLHMYA